MSIPEELKTQPRWVLWKYEDRDGKATKVPYTTSDTRASSTDATTWTTFSEATFANECGSEPYSGVGFNLGSPYVGVDLDKCRNKDTGELGPWAQEIIASLNSYAEVSPSGTGVHIFIKGNLPAGRNRRGKLEAYSTGRYFTMTGDHLAGTPEAIREISDDDLKAWHAKYLLTAETSTTTATAGADTSCSAKEFAAACEAWRKLGADATDDDVRLEFFKSVPLRDKLNREDYVSRTMQAAREKVFPAASTAAAPVVEAVEDQEPEIVVTKYPVYPRECLVGDDLAEYARLVTGGTAVPPEFVYETAGTVLSAMGQWKYAKHLDLATRDWTILIAEPHNCKGASLERTQCLIEDVPPVNKSYLRDCIAIMKNPKRADEAAALKPDPDLYQCTTGLIGSGQFGVAVFSLFPNLLMFAREFSDLLTRAGAPNSNLGDILPDLYDGKPVDQGSFTNGIHETHGQQLSLVGHTTPKKWENAVGGKGFGGNGFLSRLRLVYASRIRGLLDWAETDQEAVAVVVRRLFEHRDRPPTVITETPDATAARGEFQLWSEEQRDYEQRLTDHLKRDAMRRAWFAGKNVISLDIMQRSIAWARYQRDMRESFWMQDTGSLTERMEDGIKKMLADQDMSSGILPHKMHLDRLGRGGAVVYNAALNALLRAELVGVLGETRKGSPILGVRRVRPAGAVWMTYEAWQRSKSKDDKEG